MFKPPAAGVLLQLPGRISQFLAWLAIALTAATLARLINGLDRSLELTDESFYLLGALHPDSIHLFSAAIVTGLTFSMIRFLRPPLTGDAS